MWNESEKTILYGHSVYQMVGGEACKMVVIIKAIKHVSQLCKLSFDYLFLFFQTVQEKTFNRPNTY